MSDVTADSAIPTPPAPEAPAPEAPAPVQEAPATAPPQPAPWSADLEAYITDPAAREQADRYMREKVQPRITQLEDSPAQRLYKDLTDQSKQDVTVAAVVSQIYGEEYAEKFIDLFGEEGEGLEEGQTIEEGVEEAAAAPDPNAEWVAQKRAEEEQAKAEQEYDTFIDSVIAEEEFKLTEVDKPLLAPFMATSETVGEAVSKYHAYVASFAQAHNMTPAEAAAAADPPPALNGPGAAAATPPLEQPPGKWEDIGQLAQDYVREQAAKRPPATL
jgi:hypothetical protein